MRITDDKTILDMLKDGKTQKEIAAHFGVSPAAICKRAKWLLPPPESLEELTEKSRPSQLPYPGHDTDRRGNDSL